MLVLESWDLAVLPVAALPAALAPPGVESLSQTPHCCLPTLWCG